MNLPELPHTPQRVVSLVPSITESLFDLGLGDRVVGVTDYCIYPKGIDDSILRIGGVKDPDIVKIQALHPDLILANQEENSREPVEDLMASGIPVWVTFPKTCRQVIEDLWAMVGLFQDENCGRQVRSLEVALEWAEFAAGDLPSRTYFCPIWQTGEGARRTWLTFNWDTYCNDILKWLGGNNPFADREQRYPEVTLAEVRYSQPEVILLPSEPYEFGLSEQRYFQSEFPEADVRLIDGTLVTWSGTRLGKALGELPACFA